MLSSVLKFRPHCDDPGNFRVWLRYYTVLGQCSNLAINIPDLEITFIVSLFMLHSVVFKVCHTFNLQPRRATMICYNLPITKLYMCHMRPRC